MATLIRSSSKSDLEMQDPFHDLAAFSEHLDDNILPASGLTFANKVSKWAKVLDHADAAPAFVPVKHYSIMELFRLRDNANPHAKYDDHHIEESCSPRQRSPTHGPMPVVNPIPMIEPLFVPLFVPPVAPEEEGILGNAPPPEELKASKSKNDKAEQNKENARRRQRSRRGAGHRKPESKTELAEKDGPKKVTSSAMRRRRRAQAKACK